MTNQTATFLYFGYGSNMSTARLKARTPTCIPLGVATLSGHDLCFHKLSNDGTAKCDAFQTGNANDAVIGVLFEIARSDKRALDRAEGLGHGYNEKLALVRRPNGEEAEALLYYADPTAINKSKLPTREYRQYAMDGAVEHGIPAAYIEKKIASVGTCD